MRLTSVHIENFRGLKDISFDLPNSATVIVGPNAIGKSSVLEAIRLAKAILAPRFVGEGQQVLQSLSAHVPHLNAIKFDALVGDVASPMRVTLKVDLSPDEVQLITSQLPQLARLRVRNLLGNVAADDLALVQYLSSPQGQAQYSSALNELETSVQQLEASPSIVLGLEIEASTSRVQGTNLFHQEVAQTIVANIPPSLGSLTYFPADRAMPSGEVNIQIGSSDAAAQLYSHLGQPATKYQRLKQHIVNQSLTNAAEAMRDDFAIVFNKLLTGKELDDLGLTQEGMLTVRIREPQTSAVYDIDSMSSGEKGLLLTFFLMKRSTAPGGIILLDEPELHLNPTVSRKIIPFLRDEVLEPLNIQAIICTHSPEMTAHAYDDSDCTLLHLRSSRDISPIYQQDKGEVYEALKRLGSEPSDILFSRGSLYVEGEHDADLLITGWLDRVAGYKITELGGRSAVEKEIKNLQAAEREAKLDASQCFIFDLDRKPTGLSDTPLVKVQQWDRYCLENYLLDPDTIYDVCKANNFTEVPSRGELATLLRETSLAQLRGVIARDVYQAKEPDNPGFRPELASIGSYDKIGKALLVRLESIRDQIISIDSSIWLQEFEATCEARDNELREQWREKWSIQADGKRVLHEVFRQVGPTCSFLDFKRRIVETMLNKKTETWRVVDNILSAALMR